MTNGKRSKTARTSDPDPDNPIESFVEFRYDSQRKKPFQANVDGFICRGKTFDKALEGAVRAAGKCKQPRYQETLPDIDIANPAHIAWRNALTAGHR